MTDYIIRPESSTEAWTDSQRQPTARILRSRTPSPTMGHRPKSSPAGSRNRVHFQNRPKTAAIMTGCERVRQVEHEPTRQHKFENNLRLQKNRPPPWQKSLDLNTKCTSIRNTGQSPYLMPQHVAPGYILTKSRSKIAMTINMEEFFNPAPVEKETRNRLTSNPELEAFSAQLKQQVSDLTLFLEEERLNHRETKRKDAEYLKDKLEELKTEHVVLIKHLDGEHEEEKNSIKLLHQKELSDKENASDLHIVRTKGEIEFLQGAFDSFKTQITLEMQEKWNKKEKELSLKFSKEMQSQVHEIKTKLIQEKNAERANLTKEHNKTMALTKKEHKKEMDALTRRFMSAASDLEKMKKTVSELNDTKRELEELKVMYESTTKQLNSLTQELTDTKIKLVNYEENFYEKVQQVDEKYRHQIHALMTQNTEIRRMYAKKCSELVDSRTAMEKNRVEKLKNAKDAMQILIETRSRSNVSIAAVDPTLDAKPKIPLERPASAPTTRFETKTAKLSAGQTEHVIEKQREHEDKKFIRPHTSIEDCLRSRSLKASEIPNEKQEDIDGLPVEMSLKTSVEFVMNSAC